MADVDTHKLLDGNIRTVEELFSKRYGLDYYQREYLPRQNSVGNLGF